MKWKLSIGVLVGCFLFRGISLICLLPPTEMWDEPSHLAYIDFWYHHHQVPIYGKSMMSHDLLQRLCQLPQCEAAGFGTSYSKFWRSRNVQRDPPARTLYEAQQPPLYYVGASFAYGYCGASDNLILTSSILRLINLIVGTSGITVVLWWIYKNLSWEVATAGGSLITLHPLTLLNVTRIANDPLAFTLGSVVVVTSLSMIKYADARKVIIVSLVLPISILVKLTNVTLLPVVLFALLCSKRKSIGIRRVSLEVLFFVAFFVAFLAPYIINNIEVYGVAFLSQEAVVNQASSRSIASTIWAVPIHKWPIIFASWWIVNGIWTGGWSFLSLPFLFAVIHGVTVLIAVASLCRKYRELVEIASVKVIVLWVTIAVCVQGAMMFHACQSAAAWDGRVTTNPWYAAVAYPWVLLLVSMGSLKNDKYYLRGVVVLIMPINFIVAEGVGQWIIMPRKYYGGLIVNGDVMARCGSIHSSMFGPKIFLLSSVIGLLLEFAIVCVLLKIAFPTFKENRSKNEGA